MHFLHKAGNLEIIETYWNVNQSCPKKYSFCSSEIIETYWNVNSIDIAYKIAQRLGNNRNILECKYSQRRIRTPIASFEIIETYWNVNLFPYQKFIYAFGNNRNILECKYLFDKKDLNRKLRNNRNILECKYQKQSKTCP